MARSVGTWSMERGHGQTVAAAGRERIPAERLDKAANAGLENAVFEPRRV